MLKYRMPEQLEYAKDVICFRCGECCRRFQVLLDRAEVQRLAEYLGLTPEAFVSTYGDPRWPGRDTWLVKHIDNHCPFLIARDKEYLCAVHAAKPRTCREWAAAYGRTECRRGLKTCWQLEIDSEDHPRGKPEDLQAFRDFMNRCAAAE